MAKVLHASASGYFPTCLSQSSTLATQSLVDAMEIYWKVKNWRLSTSGDYGDAQIFYSSTATDETNLVCESNFSPFEYNAFFLQWVGPFVDSYSNPKKYGILPSLAWVIESEGSSFVVSSQFANIPGNILIVGSLSFYGQSFDLYGPTGTGSISGSLVPSTYWPYQA